MLKCIYSWKGGRVECTFPHLIASLAQQYYIILLIMRAGVMEVGENLQAPRIELICNQVEPHFVQARLATKKYKKVSKEAKFRLLKCIENGWSIINVSKKFGINYSTAKSIVQSQKKKALNGDYKVSSTESFDSVNLSEDL